MPVIWQETNNYYSIIVWQSTELMSVLLLNAELKNKEINEWKLFRSETRKREWLTVRNALKSLHPDLASSSIYYDSNGKPFLRDNKSVSISHSHDFVALMTANNSRIGIDIEFIHHRIINLSQKFLSDEEKQNVIPENQIEKLHVMWGAKEVLYKIHSIGGIDFKKDFYVHPFSYKKSGDLKAVILKKGFEKEFNIFYKKIGNYMLAWAKE